MLESFKIGIKVGLIDVAISFKDVVDEVLDFNSVEAFGRIFKFSIEH